MDPGIVILLRGAAAAAAAAPGGTGALDMWFVILLRGAAAAPDGIAPEGRRVRRHGAATGVLGLSAAPADPAGACRRRVASGPAGDYDGGVFPGGGDYAGGVPPGPAGGGYAASDGLD